MGVYDHQIYPPKKYGEFHIGPPGSPYFTFIENFTWKIDKLWKEKFGRKIQYYLSFCRKVLKNRISIAKVSNTDMINPTIQPSEYDASVVSLIITSRKRTHNISQWILGTKQVSGKKIHHQPEYSKRDAEKASVRQEILWRVFNLNLKAFIKKYHLSLVTYLFVLN